MNKQKKRVILSSKCKLRLHDSHFSLAYENKCTTEEIKKAVLYGNNDGPK